MTSKNKEQEYRIKILWPWLLAGLVILLLGGFFAWWQWGNIKKNVEPLKIVGGAMLASFGFYLSYRRTAELKRQNDTNEKVLAETAKNNLAQQRQNSLQSAIEHLGDKDSEAIRIGAIYELYHLARQHEEQRETVQDILCSYIRMRSTEKAYIEAYHQTRDKENIAEEIQTALNILFKKEELFNLCNIDLQRANLQKANLQKAYLQGANLQEVDLQEANLQKANLRRAKFEGADLQGANLQWTYLEGAGLQGADLQWTDLQEAFFGYDEADQMVGWEKKNSQYWEKKNSQYWETEGWEAMEDDWGGGPVKVLWKKDKNEKET